MIAAQSVTDLRRFMGMTNQLGKFSPRLAELGGTTHGIVEFEERLDVGFTFLTRPTVLTLYDSRDNTKVSADASSFGLGAVLLQQSGSSWRLIAYASRTL